MCLPPTFAPIGATVGKQASSTWAQGAGGEPRVLLPSLIPLLSSMKESVAKRGFAALERPPLREREVHGGKTVGFPLHAT